MTPHYSKHFYTYIIWFIVVNGQEWELAGREAPHPGQAVSSSQGHAETNNHARSRSLHKSILNQFKMYWGKWSEDMQNPHLEIPASISPDYY